LPPYDSDFYYNVDAAKWQGLRQSNNPFDGLQNLLKAGFLNRSDIPLLRRLIRQMRADKDEIVPGYKEEGYEMAVTVKQTAIAELERIISLINEQPITGWDEMR
jgi:hypothetical protein